MNLLRVMVVASVIALAGLFWMASRPAEVAVSEESVASAAAFGVRDVRVFDGERVFEHVNVLVRDGLIVSVGAEALPEDVAIVEGTGRTLLPGLIDAHVHSWGEARRDALRFGVTTQLDMFSDPSQLAAARTERVSLDATDRADLWSAGFLATAAGGHGTQFGMAVPTLASASEATAWVAARKAEGSDYIKLVREDMHAYGSARSLPTLDRATAAAVIAAAHAQGLRAVVHVSTLADARESIEDGADGLVHVFHDLPADDAFIALAKEKHVFVVPTLTVVAGFSGRATTLPTDPRVLPWLTAEQLGSLTARFPLPPQPQHVANALDSVRRLHTAGVPILAGTDAPNPNTAHGVSLHDELAWLVDAGLTPIDALAAATSRPADAFGLRDRGRIKPGLRADLLLVEGDATRDITVTRAIATLWKNGRSVDRPLQAATAQIAAPGTTLAPGSIGEFDDGTLAAQQGAWLPTSDEMAGGTSSARIASLALENGGALRITGRVELAFAYPWAGAFFAPGAQPMQPVDARRVRELVFRARGDGRDYAVMVFSGQQQRPIPVQSHFTPERDWTEIRIALKELDGVDLRHLRGLAFAASAPAGDFQLDLDHIELR